MRYNPCPSMKTPTSTVQISQKAKPQFFGSRHGFMGPVEETGRLNSVTLAATGNEWKLDATAGSQW